MANETFQEDLENEEQTSQESVNEQDENTQESEEQEQQDGESSEDYKARIEALEKKNKELYARLKRDNKKESKAQVDNLDLMEFFAKGGTRDDFEQLQTIMAGKGLSMKEAMEDGLYTAYKNQKALEAKEEASQISSQKRGGSSKKEETVAERHARKMEELRLS